MSIWIRSIAILAVAIAAASGCSGTVASPSPPPAGLPPGFPLGSWTSTLTEADLRAAGFTDQGLISENAGAMTFALTPDGTWTHSLDTPEAVRVAAFRGTYAATGVDTFEMRTTFPPDFEGEVVELQWQVKDGTLHLHAIDPPDPIISTQFETHPWTPKE